MVFLVCSNTNSTAPWCKLASIDPWTVVMSSILRLSLLPTGIVAGVGGFGSPDGNKVEAEADGALRDEGVIKDWVAEGRTNE